MLNVLDDLFNTSLSSWWCHVWDLILICYFCIILFIKYIIFINRHEHGFCAASGVIFWDKDIGDIFCNVYQQCISLSTGFIGVCFVTNFRLQWRWKVFDDIIKHISSNPLFYHFIKCNGFSLKITFVFYQRRVNLISLVPLKYWYWAESIQNRFSIKY